jgi:hypothetical protein
MLPFVLENKSEMNIHLLYDEKPFHEVHNIIPNNFLCDNIDLLIYMFCSGFFRDFF